MADIVNMKVVGVGGAGNNVVGRMIMNGIDGVTYCCINTDRAALGKVSGAERLQIGDKLTRGQGAGSKPQVGRMAAEEDRAAIDKLFEGTDMVFITAGMGGGTGTGAAPVVAEAARAAGALTIGVVTMPFRWEGSRKMRVAEAGVEELLKQVDTLFVIPNENLRKVTEMKVSLAEAFQISDEVLQRTVVGLSRILSTTGFINLDFADVRHTLRGSGLAHLGVAEASGKSKVEEAAAAVMRSELTDTGVHGARRIIINVSAAPDVDMDDVSAVMDRIQEAVHPDANIIFGCDFDEHLSDALRVIFIATDFAEDDGSYAAAEAQTARSAREPVREPVREARPARRESAPAEPKRGGSGDTSEQEWDVIWDSFFKKN